MEKHPKKHCFFNPNAFFKKLVHCITKHTWFLFFFFLKKGEDKVFYFMGHEQNILVGGGFRLLCLISSLFEIINQKIRLFYCSYSKSITSHSKYLHLIASAEGRASDSILQITCKPDKALTLIYSTWESLKFHYFHSSN